MNGNNSLMKRIATNSNNVGIAFFIALTNDLEIDYGRLVPAKIDGYCSPYKSTVDTFIPLQNSSLSLTSNNRVSQEQVLLEFANKMLLSSTELDSDIKKALEAGYWDLI